MLIINNGSRLYVDSLNHAHGKIMIKSFNDIPQVLKELESRGAPYETEALGVSADTVRKILHNNISISGRAGSILNDN